MKAHESYVNPNARCPVCGESVFFYLSPEDGRVFFDELGPPWPKHPCTDFNSVPALDSRHEILNSKYGWERDGWSPLVGCSVISIDPLAFSIHGYSSENEIRLYVDKQEVRGKLSPGVGVIAAQSKLTSDGRYRVSIFNGRYDVVEFTGYLSKSDAEARVSNPWIQKDPHGLAHALSQRNKEDALMRFIEGLSMPKGEGEYW